MVPAFVRVLKSTAKYACIMKVDSGIHPTLKILHAIDRLIFTGD